MIVALAACQGGETGPRDGDVPDLVDAVDALPPMACPIGDLSQPPELVIMHVDPTGTLVESQPGADAQIGIPPQGGRALTFGARVKNLDGCGVVVTAWMRGPCAPAILKLDNRTLSYPLREGPDGWAQTATDQYTLLQTCPATNLDRDVFDNAFRFTLAVEDRDGRRVEREVDLVPRCAADDAECRCECDASYALGQACPPTGPDAGVPAC